MKTYYIFVVVFVVSLIYIVIYQMHIHKWREQAKKFSGDYFDNNILSSPQDTVKNIMKYIRKQENVFADSTIENFEIWNQIRLELNDQYQNKNLNSQNYHKSKKALPPLYIITPTYRRPEQLAEMTRLSQTLMHVPNLHWLVIEDAEVATPLVTKMLRRTGISFDHLVAPMPQEYKTKLVKPRGVSNRNRGLEWIRANASSGVFYFADDDNTYDLKLFEEIRVTKQVSMFPVGLVTNYGLSSPIVKNGVFVGFYDGWIGGRRFPVDMAGFAINVEFLLTRPNAKMPFQAGYEEDGFLLSLKPFNPTDIELLANNCTEILVWHTQTKKNKPSLDLDVIKYSGTNLIGLKEILV